MPKPMRVTAANATSRPDKARIDVLVDHVAERVCDLQQRWLDECKYEDFAEYELTMRTHVEGHALPGITFVKAHKRPFGFIFKLDTMPDALYMVAASSRSIGWKRVG